MNEEVVPMNAGIGIYRARNTSASNEARHTMANWLKMNRPLKMPTDARTMLVRRYPAGLLNDAEVDALIDLIDD
jgi:hypothetical protein